MNPSAAFNAFCLAGLLSFWTLAAVSLTERWLADSGLYSSCALLSAALYWRLRGDARVRLAALTLAQGVAVWVLLGQTLPFLQKHLGLRLLEQLELDSRLQKAVSQELGAARWDTFEGPTDDPLFYRRTPGSPHLHRYDNDASNPLYRVQADETGYLNLDRGAYSANRSIGAFFAGDSVLQGVGMPSCLERVKREAPVSVWNLSTGSYGPREKVNALIAYALPKRPRLLVVEFYAGNDASDMNEDLVLRGSGTFEDRFAIPELQRRFADSPVYGPLVESPRPALAAAPAALPWHRRLLARTEAWLADRYQAARGGVLCLALSRRVALRVREALRPASDAAPAAGPAPRPIAFPAYAHAPVRDDRYERWIELGMRGTLAEYARLAAAARTSTPAPRVAILYNPSSYEIYRDISVRRSPAMDRRAELQRALLLDFARRNGLAFLDLLPGFRRSVEARPSLWLYGRIDAIHWSHGGTLLAADLVLQELRRGLAAPAGRF